LRRDDGERFFKAVPTNEHKFRLRMASQLSATLLAWRLQRSPETHIRSRLSRVDDDAVAARRR
jgi:hypothetical protein